MDAFNKRYVLAYSWYNKCHDTLEETVSQVIIQLHCL